jgi:sugar lactone lactonase YvrE
MTTVACVAASADRRGEGPCWSAQDGRLYWFDIKGAKLRWLRPGESGFATVDLPVRASAAAPRAEGGLLMATERGLANYDCGSDDVELVQPIALPDGFRSNDGKIDPQGRFWWSSMDDADGARPGAIFVTDPGGRTERVIDGIHIANSMAFTADGATLLLADSLRNTIWAFDTADLSRRRTFATTEGRASPDGAAMDAEGSLWSAHWGGGCVVRYAPDGRVDRVVDVPVSQPTCCAFAGPDLDILYVTSAWDGLADPAAEPLAGHVFAFEPGVGGQPLPAFGSPP